MCLLYCKLTSHLFNLTQGWKLGSSNNLELTNDNERSGIPDSLQHESICVSEEKKSRTHLKLHCTCTIALLNTHYTNSGFPPILNLQSKHLKILNYNYFN